MTKEEAIQAMKEAKRVTHRFFTEDEWMEINCGDLRLEDGVRLSVEEFFSIRYQDYWKDGYSIKE